MKKYTSELISYSQKSISTHTYNRHISRSCLYNDKNKYINHAYYEDKVKTIISNYNIDKENISDHEKAKIILYNFLHNPGVMKRYFSDPFSNNWGILKKEINSIINTDFKEYEDDLLRLIYNNENNNQITPSAVLEAFSVLGLIPLLKNHNLHLNRPQENNINKIQIRKTKQENTNSDFIINNKKNGTYIDHQAKEFYHEKIGPGELFFDKNPCNSGKSIVDLSNSNFKNDPDSNLDEFKRLHKNHVNSFNNTDFNKNEEIVEKTTTTKEFIEAQLQIHNNYLIQHSTKYLPNLLLPCSPYISYTTKKSPLQLLKEIQENNYDYKVHQKKINNQCKKLQEQVEQNPQLQNIYWHALNNSENKNIQRDFITIIKNNIQKVDEIDLF